LYQEKSGNPGQQDKTRGEPRKFSGADFYGIRTCSRFYGIQTSDFYGIHTCGCFYGIQTSVELVPTAASVGFRLLWNSYLLLRVKFALDSMQPSGANLLLLKNLSKMKQ
jgi:hypothetical protein